jgi:hypothetical protein
MYEIILDDVQSSVVTAAPGPVQVCDGAGQVLGQIVPNGKHDGQQMPNGEYGSGRAGRLDPDHWVKCWNEWYFSTTEEE